MNARIQILRQVLTRKWFNDQRRPLELVSGNLLGKTVVITGSNVGIGFEAAKHFAEMNPERLILACRNVEAGNSAVQEISESTGCTSVACWPLDLGSFASIREFVKHIEDENIRVDILVGNAAIMSSKLTTTADSWETMLQVNYLSNVLLTMLLLPHMSRPTKDFTPRVILLSSEAHYFIPRLQEADGPEIMSKLNDQKYCSKSQYPLCCGQLMCSVLVLFFARELAHRINPETGPIIVAVTPGLCSSDIDIESATIPIIRHIKGLVLSFIARTPEMGSRTIIHAAVNHEGRVQHGKYLANCQVEKESDYSLSKDGMEVQHRLWDETMQILQNLDPKIGIILRDI
ncbi:hypothetical protein DFH09DRAFT_924004 [Mycena vulgaris]|nr:hypothetical protein DFH09DRAFT_924004 [Mycena vulgaris]